MASADVIAAVQAADEVSARAFRVVCHECEGVCYTVTVKAIGDVGSQRWETWVGKRQHLDLTAALDSIIALAARASSGIKARAAREWMLENQLTIL